MEALRRDADIVIMLHPDGQYDPKIIPNMIAVLADGKGDFVMGSRFLPPKSALAGGMPRLQIYFQSVLTAFENLMMRTNLSECHTGYRAYNRKLLETVPFLRNSNDFVFDTQMIFQAARFDFRFAGSAGHHKVFQRGVIDQLCCQRQIRPEYAVGGAALPAPSSWLVALGYIQCCPSQLNHRRHSYGAAKMHVDEIETDAMLVRSLFAAQFPQWADLPVTLGLNRRDDNAIYRLGDDKVVRLPIIYWATEQIHREHRWLPQIAPLLPLAVPVPIAKGEPGAGYLALVGLSMALRR